MIPIKIILAGLTGALLCMANISGIVTDTGTTPFTGAVVKLEKGGQTATTDSEGKFTFTISTSISQGNYSSIPDGLSARISANMLYVTMVEQSAIEITTFDINGKLLSTVHKTLDAGNNSIGLPKLGEGVYFNRVRTGNTAFMIKSNVVGGISFGSSSKMEGTAVKGFAKQAKSAAMITDVIAATKTGLLNYRCVIGNSDTSGVVIKMIANAGDMTDIDGNVYQTVKIEKQVWIVENLRVTKYNDGTLIPLDTSETTWDVATTPKYCYYKNTTNADSIRKYGALYNWYVVSPANLKRIAPTGWHVPTDAEWDTLLNYLIVNGYNWDATKTGNKVAQSLAAKTDWATSTRSGAPGNNLTLNNNSGFSALPVGYRNDNGYFYNQSTNGRWWSATEDIATYAFARYLGYEYLYRSSHYKSCGLSVRLLRD